MPPFDSTPKNTLAERALNEHLPAKYLVLPPTTRFKFPVVAHGEYGLVAVVPYDDLYALDPDSGRWEGTKDVVDPPLVVARSIQALVAATGAAPDRIACVVWLPSGIGGGGDVVCASSNPADLALHVARAMTGLTAVAGESLSPWIGAYASAALSSKPNPPVGMRRLVPLIESVIAATVRDAPVLCHGAFVGPEDLANPRLLLPALATAAFEDWGVVVGVSGRGGGRAAGGAGRRRGFTLRMEPDPGALLGYRVDSLTPNAPYVVLAPIVSTLRRCLVDGEFSVDEMTEQFARYLAKHGLDALAVSEIDTRILAIGDVDD